MPCKRTLFLSLLCALATGAFAQNSNLLKAKRIEAPPKIDGVIVDEDWKDIPSFEGLVETSSEAVAPVSGKFWLGYDRKFIFFAARLYDPEPGRIVATEYRTNQSLFGNDTVTLEIDPFGNLSDFNSFTMNANGATSIQIAGGRAAKREWLGEILSKGRVTKEGWEVECRIPWAIMRLPGAGPREVIFNVLRYHQALGRTFAWRNTTNIKNYGRWQTPEIPAVEAKSAKFLPYTFQGYDRQNGILSNSGLDARIPVTDKVDFAASINPDFRNVENSVLNLGFSYFERITSETRPFFLEGSQYFRTSGDGAIFNSQRINRFDVGGKFYGKLTPNLDIGILNTDSFGSQDVNVFRVRRTLRQREFIDVAYAGDREPGIKSDATFFQYQRPQGNWQQYFQIGDSRDSQNGYGHRLDVGASFDRGGYGYGSEYYDVSPNYNPRLGFAPESGYRGLKGYAYTYRPLKTGTFVEQGLNFNYNLFRDVNGGWYRREGNFGGNVTLRRFPLQIGGSYDYSRFRGNNDEVATLFANFPHNNPYTSISIERDFGHVDDSLYIADSIQVAFKPLKKLQTNATVSRLRLGESVSNQIISSAQYDLGNDRYINGRLVKQGHDSNAYLSFQRSGAKGLEYYLILGDPNATKTRSALVLKVVMPFESKVKG